MTKKSVAERKLEALAAELSGGSIRISARGVPYFLLPEQRISVSYFGRNRQFAVFSGFCTPSNRREGLYATATDAAQAIEALISK